MKKLTAHEIDEIYEFTKRHYVEWYDVQTELVDHLATGIEDQWKNFPHRSFDQALTREFKKFGISGFYDLVEQKTNALNKLYRRQIWIYFKDFFGLPKVIITLFSIWTLYELLNFVRDKKNIMWTFLIAIVLVHLFHIITSKINIRIKQKRTGRKWLVDNILIQLGGMAHFLNIGIWIHFFFKSDRVWTNTSELIVSIGIVMYFLCFIFQYM